MFKHHLQSPHVYPSSAGWSHKTCNNKIKHSITNNKVKTWIYQQKHNHSLSCHYTSYFNTTPSIFTYFSNKKKQPYTFPTPIPLLKVSHQNSSYFVCLNPKRPVETARPCPRRCTKEYFSIPWMSNGNPQPSENSTHGNPMTGPWGIPFNGCPGGISNQSIHKFF